MFLTASPLADLLLLGILAVMIGHHIYLRSKGRYMLLDPLNAFWGGCLVVYILQPAVYYNTFREWHSSGIVELTLFWIFIGLISVVLGYELPMGVKFGMVLPRFPDRLDKRKMIISACILLFCGFLGLWYQASSAGGWNNWISVGRTALREGVSGYLGNLDSLLPVGVLILLICEQYFGKPWSFRRAMVWGLGGMMWMWFVYLGSRSRTTVFLILMIAVHYLPRRKNPPLYFVLPLAICLFFLTNFLGEYRGGFTNLDFHLERLNWPDLKVRVFAIVMADDVDVQMARRDVSKGIEFNCVASVVDLVPNRVDYNYGYGLLEFFTRPIPRSIWPNKRYPRSEAYTPIHMEAGTTYTWIDYTYKPMLIGPSFTYVGFAYAAGGPIGTIFFGFVLGILFRTIRTFYDRDPTSQGGIIIYIMLVQIGFGESAGEPFIWPMVLPLALVPLATFLYFCRDKKEYDTPALPAVSPA